MKGFDEGDCTKRKVHKEVREVETGTARGGVAIKRYEWAAATAEEGGGIHGKEVNR